MSEHKNIPDPIAPLNATQIIAWLEFEQSDLVEQIAQAMTRVGHAAFALSGAETRQTLAEAGAAIAAALALMRAAEDHRKVTKAPFLDGGRTIDGWFKRRLEPLSTAMQPVQKALDAFAAREEAARREAAEKAAQAAREAAEKAATLAARTRGKSTGLGHLQAAITAEQEALVAEAIAAGTVASLVPGRTSEGGAMSGREVWQWELVDIAAVPLEFVTINETLVNQRVRDYVREHAADARAGGSPIPGIRLVRDVVMRPRR